MPPTCSPSSAFRTRARWSRRTEPHSGSMITQPMPKYLSACALLLAHVVLAPAAPTLKDARQRWLRGTYAEAREIYEELAKDESSDPILRLETGNAYRRIGEIHHKLGNTREAERAFQKAHEILGRLVNEHAFDLHGYYGII